MTASANPYGANPHGVYLDRDRNGVPRVSVCRARKRNRGRGSLRMAIVGSDRDIAYPYLSSILYDHTGKRFRFDEVDLSEEYHAISEQGAIQMMLLMDAVRGESRFSEATALARAIAAMNHCEAGWWWAQFKMKHRPRRVMRALALMYA